MTDEQSPVIRVAIADDQELIRMGLRMVLDVQPDIEVVAEAADGIAAAELDASGIDVILMDVRMPRLDGIAATERIVSRPDAPRVLVLTTFDLDEYAFAAIRSGASGFLLKDARPAELLAAIRAVHSGDAALAPSVTRKLMERFAAAPGTRTTPGAGSSDASPSGTPPSGTSPSGTSPSGTPASGAPASGASPSGTSANETHSAPAASASLAALTPREHEILEAIAEGLTNDELAAKFFLSSSTIKTHIGRLLQKLGARDRVHLVIIAYEAGLAG